MVNNLDEYEDPNESDLVKQLRAQIKKQGAELSELKEENVSLKSTFRSKTIEDVLTSKGVNKRISKYIDSSINTEEEIVTWLQENAEDFGFKLDDSSVTAPAQPAATQEEIQTTTRLNNLNSSGQSLGITEDFQSQIKNAQSDEEVDEILARFRGVINQ
jgi:hypothetical protein